MLGSGAIEKRMHELGVERYRNRVAKGKRSKTRATQFLLQEAVCAVSMELERWTKEVDHKKRGRRVSILPYIKNVPPDLAAFFAVRTVLDAPANSAKYSSLAHRIGRDLMEEMMLRQFSKEGKAHMRKVLLQWGKRGHSIVVAKAKEAMAILGIDFEPWPKEIRVKIGARLLDIIVTHTEIITLDWVKNRRGHKVYIISPSASLLEWLRKAHAHYEVLSPWHMPLPVPPAPWEGPYGGGYWTDILPTTPVISTRKAGAKHLDLLGKTEMPKVYQALNTVQNTAWELNPDIRFMVEHIWESGIELGGIPSRFEAELPPWGDWEKDSDEHKAWKKLARVVYDKRRDDKGMRLHAAKVLFMAKEVGDGPFYYPFHLDFRGRMYPLAYFLQPQGPSFARALLRFHEGKPITDPEAVRWFKIHGANTYGKDKISFKDRISWVDDNEDMILSIANDLLDNQEWTDADKPWEFVAWCMEYGSWKADPANFKSKIPVAMDGTTNGLQIFSLMLRDPIGAEATNCLPTDAPQDIYKRVAQRVMEILKDNMEPYSGQWLRWLGEEGLPREAVKRQVMTVPYGCTKHACRDYLLEWFMKQERPNPWPADFYMPCNWLNDIIWDAIGDIVVGARKAMNWLQEVSNICVGLGKPISWTTPSGMVVLQDYRKHKTKKIRTIAGGTVRQVRSRYTTKELSKTKSRNGISPNFVHSLDASALVETVLKSSSRGVRNYAMIHDSFGTLAADAPVLAESLREAYSDIFSENQLVAFKEEIEAQLPPGTELPPLPELGDLDPTMVIKAPYFFA